MKPVSVGDKASSTKIELVDTQLALSVDPIIMLKVSSNEIPLSLKDISALKKLLSEGESLLKDRKDQYLKNNNLNLF